MKFAVIKTGGKQYRVKTGDVLMVEKLPLRQAQGKPAAKGDSLEFSEVLLLDDGAKTSVGAPMLKGAKVAATLVEEGKGKKILVVKFKNKTRIRVTRGHRQPYTKVKIGEITSA